MSNIALIAGNLVSDSGASLSSKADLVDGKVPSTQLPSYVDDVLEYANLAGFPVTGEAGKIYVAQDSNKIYRWSGTTYIEVSPTVGTVWGGITGTLLNQTDLQAALDAKVAGTGAVNYIPKFTGTSALGNSQIFDNGTSVGIGTASPVGGILDVATSATAVTRIRSTNASNGAYALFQNGTTGTGGSNGYLIGTDNSLSYVWNYESKPISFATNATERLRITSDGNVGIGDTSPSDLLVVNGRMRVNGANPIAFGNSAGGYAQIGVTAATTGNLAFSTYDGASLGERMRITAAGNVGIGTTSPTNAKLQIVESVSGIVHQKSIGGYFYGTGFNGNDAFLTHYTQNNFIIGYGSSTGGAPSVNTLTLTNAGNVGIGTTSPDGTSLRIVPTSTDAIQRVLHIGYNGSMSSGTHGSLITFGNSTPSTAQLARIGAFYEGNTYMGSLRFYTNADTEGANPSEKMRITQAGNVGIGKTTVNTKLDIAATKNTTGLRLSPIGASTAGDYTQIGIGDAPMNVDYAALRFIYENGLGNWFNTSIAFLTHDAFPGNSITEKMRITSAGNVGIGATNPGSMINTGAFFKPEAAGEHLDILSPSNEAVLNLRSNRDTSGGQVGGIYFTRDSGQGDAHRHIAGIQARQKQTGTLAGGELLFFTKPANGGVGVDVSRMTIDSAGGITLSSLAGTGTRIVTADTNGFLAASTLSSSIVGGSGTVNYLSKFTATGTIGNSQIFDDGVSIGIGTSSPTQYTGYSTLELSKINGGILRLKNDASTGVFEAAALSTLTYIKNVTATDLWFGTNNTERLRITSSGNVGIGTASPAAKLDIAHSINPTTATPHILLTTAGTVKQAAITAESSSVSGLVFSVGDGTLVDRMTILRSNGNVGIGTTSPSAKLHVVGQTYLTDDLLMRGTYNPYASTDRGVIQLNGTGGNLIGFASSTTQQGYLFVTGTVYDFVTVANQPIRFYNGGTEALRITNAGNVGIGTATPTSRLDVFTTATNGIDLRNAPTTLGDQTSKNSPRLRLVSSRYEGGNVDAPFSFQNVRTGSPTNDQRLAITNFGDVEVMSILNAGNVGIANPNPVNRLHVYSPNRTSLTATGGGINLNYNGSTTGEFSTIGFSWASSVNDHTRWGMGLTGTNFASGLADLFFFNGGVERMRVNSFGHVGIGVTPSSWSGVSPSLQLGVSPFIASTGQYLYLASNMYYDGTNGIYTSNGSATTYAQSEGNHMFNTAGSGTTGGIATFTERMRITSGGNVGIGTQTPALRAQINASGAGSPATSGTTQTGALRLSNGYSNVVADFGFDISNNVWMQMTNAAALGTNYNLLINPNGGNVGIGTTSPNARLEVRDGDISVSTFNTFSYFNANRLTVLSGVGQILGGLRFQAYSTGTTLVQGAQILAYSNEAWTSSTAATYLSFQTTQSGAITTTERMRIFPNGRIGINTTTDAGYQLDVNGGTRVTGRLTITGNDTLAQTMSRAGTSAFSAEIYNSGGDNSWLIWGVESSVGGVIFPGSTAYAAVIGQFRNTPLEFFTNNTIRGSFSGAGAFRVHNLAGTGSRIVVADANGVLSTTDTAPVTGTGTTNYIPKFTAGSTIGNSVIFNSSTNVGINTASPASILHVYGPSSGDNIRIQTAGVSALKVFSNNQTSNSFDFAQGFASASDNVGYVWNNANAAMVLGTNATERFRIFANGRIGVNTTTDAGYQFDINGTLRSVNGANFATTSGNVGIGTASPTSKIEVIGNAIFRSTNRIDLNTAQASASGILAGSSISGYSNFSIYSATGTAGESIDVSYWNGSTYYPALRVNNVSSGFGSLQLMKDGGEVLIATTTDAGDYKLQVAGNIYNTGSAVLAATSGNVGVGLVPVGQSGFKTLEIGGTGVSGLIDVYQGTTRQLRIYNSGSDTYLANVASGGGMLFRTTTSGGTQNNNVAIFTTGRVGVNTTTDAGYQLDVNGSFRASGVIRSAAPVGVTTGFFQLDHAGAQTWKIGVFSDNTSTFSIGNDLAGTFASRYLNITNAGNVLIGTTTSLEYRLQVNGSVYNTGQVTAGVINIQGTGAQLFVDGTTNLSPLSAIQTLSGASNSAFLSGNVTWNTTGSPNAIDISVTNTASGSNANFMQLGDGTNNFKVTKDAGIITANPTSGTARKWKLGSVVSSTVVLVTSQYVEVEINGTFYRLALVTPA